ncbi:Peptidoglycan/LPS O-acetylase OafA/YrhL, contains acyltransferase and SGNH-hydrolase domains [Granulicella pectinivorans]|uniref:Peptidoglycan/LPS O-acetylase OafA/YrhL, contains acyltransferase and SGNH-hydrolase domains n=1 Tax=Granulicella pectinivorans TaxID=474950 RepID=A0A1I6MMR3_9BACT|nr:Peptidoglycan/LPS O-acetylase OafA/YrhL, contains acyltransferase and SGNH-hydrolase domains [Granulicella pectinivorans]
MVSFPSLRRITASGAYLPEIDGLRFMAIFAVLVFHVLLLSQTYMGYYALPSNAFAHFTYDLMLNGRYGVPVFFAISGFILGLPFAKQYLNGGKKIGFGPYLMRRVTRLEPPYILSLLIRTGPVMAAKGYTFLWILPHLLASIFYLDMAIYRDYPVVQLVAWSLEIEIQFYLLIFLLAPLLFRAKATLRRCVFVFALFLPGTVQYYLWNYTGLSHHDLFFYSIGVWIQFFLAGMLVADIFVTDLGRIPSTWLWDVLSAVVWIVFFIVPDGGSQVFGPAMLVLLLLGAFKGKVFRWFYSLSPISIIGGMCYSIYLTHSLVLQALAFAYYKMAPRDPSYLRFVVSILIFIPLLIAAGAVFFVLIERPCMDRRWPQKLLAFLSGKREAPKKQAVTVDASLPR